MPDETLPSDSTSTSPTIKQSEVLKVVSLEVAALELDLEVAQSDLKTAQSKLSNALSTVSQQQSTIYELRNQVIGLEARIEVLQAELAKYKPQPQPTPDPTPTPVPDPVPDPKPDPIPDPVPSPDLPNVVVSLTLDGALRSYRPSGQGLKRGSSLRWYKRISDKVGIWLYLTKQTEIRVSVGQCFSNLIDPKLAPNPIQNLPPIHSHLTIDIDNARVYDRAIVLHPHSRHSKRFRQLPHPTNVDIEKLSAQNLIPNYIQSVTTPSTKDLTLMKEKRWPWAHFSALGRDPFSEEYGLNSGSWTGGIPSMDGTEGATVSKSDLFAARVNPTNPLAPIAWDNVFVTADSMGNYPIHYINPDTGDPIWPEDTPHLEQPDGKALLVGDSIHPRLKLGGKPDGIALPLCDTAHMPSFIYFAGLVTGDAYLEELQQSWAMLGVLCKTRNDGRLWGSVASGQVRAWVWGIRCILHLYLLSEGERKERARAWLVRVIKSFNMDNATPGAKFHRPDCLFGTIKPKSVAAGSNAFFRFIRNPEQMTTTMWWLGPFSHIMHQCLRAGISEAEQALTYSLGIQRGWWEAVSARSPVLCAWPNIAVASSGKWVDHERLTFELATSETLPTTLPDGFYTGCYRSACVAAADLGQQWGRDAVKFIDGELARTGRTLPPTWAFKVAS